LIVFIASWGPQTQPAWSDLGWFVGKSNAAITDHVYGQKTPAWLQTRYNYFTSAGVPVWLGEIGFTSAETGFELTQLQSYDALDLHYTLFVYGVSSWNLSYDIVDSNYLLKPAGVIYRDYLAGLVPTPTPTDAPTMTATFTPTNTATLTPTRSPKASCQYRQ
jgi:hypothetical protein